MMLRCGTGPVATRKASTASIFLDPSFRAVEFFGLVQGSSESNSPQIACLFFSSACSLKYRQPSMATNNIALTILLSTTAAASVLVIYPCSWKQNSDIFCPGLDTINTSAIVSEANWSNVKINRVKGFPAKMRRNFRSLYHTKNDPWINITSIQKVSKGVWRASLCTKDKNCEPAVLVGQRSLHEKKQLETSALKWISWKEAKKMLSKGRVLMFLHLSVMRFTFYFEEEIVGPADVRGSCPEGSYIYKYKGVDNCCCDHGCCWVGCSWETPPEWCLPEGAKWVQNSVWDTTTGKVTQKYVATLKGNFGTHGELVPPGSLPGKIPGGRFICRAQEEHSQKNVGTMCTMQCIIVRNRKPNRAS